MALFFFEKQHNSICCFDLENWLFWPFLNQNGKFLQSTYIVNIDCNSKEKSQSKYDLLHGCAFTRSEFIKDDRIRDQKNDTYSVNNFHGSVINEQSILEPNATI